MTRDQALVEALEAMTLAADMALDNHPLAASQLNNALALKRAIPRGTRDHAADQLIAGG